MKHVTRCADGHRDALIDGRDYALYAIDNYGFNKSQTHTHTPRQFPAQNRLVFAILRVLRQKQIALVRAYLTQMK